MTSNVAEQYPAVIDADGRCWRRPERTGPVEMWGWTSQSELADPSYGIVEDREYVDVDLALPQTERCGASNPRWGRRCSRRKNHVNRRHRDGEVSWEV
jgi:hypothetical protein